MPAIPEPVWTDPTLVDIDPPTSFRGTSIRPSYMTGFLLRLLEHHFTYPENIVNPQLKDAIWKSRSDDENQQTGVLIATWDTYDAAMIDMRPAIYVARGVARFQNMTINRKTFIALNKEGNFDGENYLMTMNAQHRIVCCCKGFSAASDALAEEILFMLIEYSPVIKNDAQLAQFTPRQMTDPIKLKESPQGFATGVQIDWATFHSWKIKSLSPILREVGFLPATV